PCRRQMNNNASAYPSLLLTDNSQACSRPRREAALTPTATLLPWALRKWSSVQHPRCKLCTVCKRPARLAAPLAYASFAPSICPRATHARIATSYAADSLRADWVQRLLTHASSDRALRLPWGAAMKVREIMKTELETVRPTDTLQCAAARMKANNIGALPVEE